MTFRKVVTPELPFRRLVLTLAALVHSVHLAADCSKPPSVDANTWLMATNVLDGAGGPVHTRQTVPADLRSLAIVTLLRRHELDPALPMPMVIPVDERSDPLTGLPFAGKGLVGVIRPILHRPEQ